MTDFAWECICGNVEYNQTEPDECSDCGKIGNFTQLPEELIEEREKEGLDTDLELKSLKSIGKNKPSLKKPKRRKK